MKTVDQIYVDYKIMRNLQEHQYRVAAVAKMICDNFKEKINENITIRACLFHDMGNIIKFNFEHFPEFTKPEGIDYWTSVQKSYFNRYGKDEHHATCLIVKEMGLDVEILKIIDSICFSKAKENLNSGSLETKIAAYADMRVGPHGIMTLEGRMTDIIERYANRLKDVEKKESSKVLIASLYEIEKQLFENCSIKPDDINDLAVIPIIEKLRSTEVLCEETELVTSQNERRVLY